MKREVRELPLGVIILFVHLAISDYSFRFSYLSPPLSFPFPHALLYLSIYLSDGNEIVDLEDHAHALRAEGDLRGIDEQGLNDFE